MKPYQYTRIILAIAFAGLLAAFYMAGWSYLLLWLPLVAYVIVSFYGAYFIRSGYFVAAHCNMPDAGKVVSLTFDDGPHPVYTPAILDVLDRQGVVAAFFVIGREAEKYPELIKQIHQRGHLVGNHSYDHNHGYAFKSKEQLLMDAGHCDAIITKNILKTPLFYRPPYGVTNPGIKYMVEQKQYHCIGWSLRTYDTMEKNAANLTAKVLGKITEGDVILLHDRLAVTAEALPGIISGIKQKGYRIQRVDALFHLPAYSSTISTAS